MRDPIKIQCENISQDIIVERGTSLLEMIQSSEIISPLPLIAAYVDNRLRELNFRLFAPSQVRFVSVDSFSGYRVYTRTVWMILQHACEELFPEGQLHIRHSIGEHGFYCELESHAELSDENVTALEAKMQEIVAADVPLRREKLPTSEVRERYLKRGYESKIELLDTRPRLYSEIYMLGQTIDYFYGALAPSTAYTPRFALKRYHEGIFLSLPMRGQWEDMSHIPSSSKMVTIFKQYQDWVDMLGLPTVGAINRKILKGESGEMIRIAEALHEKSVAQLADDVAKAHRERGVRLVMIAGPSSSGKTTSARRLGVQLQVLGFRPQLISLDDYFVDRDRTPLDNDGNYDFEAFEAVDVPLFNRQLERLFAGDEVVIPRYDFISGKSQLHDHPLRLDERSILIVEGIHGLNPRITPSVPRDERLNIYVSCITAVAMDNTSRIATSDNRLLRRLARDYATRGKSALDTLSQWASVRRGEERNIFPHQQNADLLFNSSLFYEIAALKRYVEPMLHEVPNTTVHYEQAHRLLTFLDNFVPISSEEIPSTSLLREFIGKSVFK